MEYELKIMLESILARQDRIRQLLSDDVDEQRLNEIFGEIPQIEEETIPEKKKTIDMKDINKIRMKPKEEENENQEWDD